MGGSKVGRSQAGEGDACGHPPVIWSARPRASGIAAVPEPVFKIRVSNGEPGSVGSAPQPVHFSHDACDFAASFGSRCEMGPGVVVAYESALGAALRDHQRNTLAAVAKAITEIKQYDFGGWYDQRHSYAGHVYF